MPVSHIQSHQITMFDHFGGYHGVMGYLYPLFSVTQVRFTEPQKLSQLWGLQCLLGSLLWPRQEVGGMPVGFETGGAPTILNWLQSCSNSTGKHIENHRKKMIKQSPYIYIYIYHISPSCPHFWISVGTCKGHWAAARCEVASRHVLMSRGPGSWGHWVTIPQGPSTSGNGLLVRFFKTSP